MNPDYEKKLAGAVHRELDQLGELNAPTGLADRIMNSVRERASVPWYHRAWPTWPLGLRIVSLTGLTAAFALLSLGTWELIRVALANPTASTWLADARALCRTAGVLGNVAQTLAGQLSPSIIVTVLVLLFAASATCIGLGSACYRLLQPRPTT